MKRRLLLPACALAAFSVVPPLSATPIAHWSMSPSGAGNTPAVLDTATEPEQGTRQGAFDFDTPPAHDHLWTFNGNGNTYAASTVTPPASMFAGGFGGGGHSYNAAALTGTDGALFFPVDQYGNEFSFPLAFTAELFFRTDGDRSNAGLMQLLMQGEQAFRFGLILNEGGAGNLRFAVNNGSQIMVVDNGAANMADGEWHYAKATYAPDFVNGGSLTLLTISESGATHESVLPLSADSGPLQLDNDGNLFIGRQTFAVDQDPRTFLGLIDEVRLSEGVVGVSEQMGVAPVPEPTSLVVLAAGMFGALRRSRMN